MSVSWPLRRPGRAVLLALCLLVGLLGTVLVGPQPAHAAAGTVTGAVFRDFDGNGTQDPGDPANGVQTDLPMAGIHVVAYDAHNVVVGRGTSAADGTYSIDTSSVPDGTPLRIEFDDAQRPGTANALPGDNQSSFHGADNGTSVQFAAAGDANVDFGVLEPEDFAAHNAPILTAIQYAGLRTDAAAPLPTVVANPWVVPQNDPANGNFPDRVNLATYGQVGSVWGTAFSRPENAAYVAATYKRISDLGPLGLGGIYRITQVLDANGDLNDPATGAVENFLDVSTLTDQAGNPIDLGTVPTSAQRGLGTPATPTRDPDAYQQAGKVGIGGIAISEDGSHLFFVNLFQKTLCAVDLTGATPTSATCNSLNLGANQRPWAVAVHRDRVYVGYVDTGEGIGPGVPAADANLGFHVASKAVASAQAGTGAWRSELNSSLGYAKGNNITNWGTCGNNCPPQTRRWNTWTDQWTWTGPNAGTVGFQGFSPTQMYPQAILGSLAFDASGRMILGFVDRASVQGGNRQLGTDPADPKFYETVSSAEMLIAAPPATAGGDFVLESNGVVGGAAGVGTGNNQGPGGGEFFEDSQGANDQGPNHFENTEGGVVTYPGIPEAASTAMDPLDAIRVTGLQWFALGDGEKLRGYNQTADPGGGVGREVNLTGGAFFQKGGGIGAVALLTRQPPVEIGNRVWLDADFNGRQDADEPNIEGAPVRLFAAGANGNPTGAVLATTNTDAAGEYYFRSSDIAGFDPNGSYVVVFGKGSGAVTLTGPSADNPGFVGLTWADLDFTTQTSAVINRDSNPNPANGRALVDVGSPGHNDHTIDAGFNATGTFAIHKLVDPAGGQPAPGQTFTFDVTAATNFRGDDVLRSITQTPITVSAGQTGPVPAERQDIPIGTTITIAERNAGQSASVSFDPGPTQLITVNGNQPIKFTVTDKLTPTPPTQPPPVVRTVTSHGRVTPGQPFHDRIHVRGLAGGHGATAVAKLYGPFTSRAAATCAAGFRVRTKVLHVKNGWNRTPSVRITTPGVYTWRVKLLADAANRSATHPCGQVVETTVVAKPPFVAPIINGGFSGTIDSRGSLARRPATISIQMPALRMHAEVRPERVTGGQMTLPGDVSEVGWLRKSAGLGDKIGTAVIAGHVSDRHDHPGALFHLSRAHAGQQVTVTRAGTRHRFTVVRKATFDRRHPIPHRYFVTTGRHRLVLITCTAKVVRPNGRFHYTRYVVVVANEVRRHS